MRVARCFDPGFAATRMDAGLVSELFRITPIADMGNMRLSKSVFLKMSLLILGECLKFKKIVLPTKFVTATP